MLWRASSKLQTCFFGRFISQIYDDQNDSDSASESHCSNHDSGLTIRQRRRGRRIVESDDDVNVHSGSDSDVGTIDGDSLEEVGNSEGDL